MGFVSVQNQGLKGPGKPHSISGTSVFSEHLGHSSFSAGPPSTCSAGRTQAATSSPNTLQLLLLECLRSGYHNKILQTEWLKPQIYSPILLEAGSLRSGYWYGW